MNARVAAAALGCLCASLALHAGQGPAPSQTLPTFRAEVRFIEVDAVVRDKDGNFVAGLTTDDFEILEDNKPQKIERLSVLNLPVDRSGRPTDNVPGGLDAQAVIQSPEDVGRIYVMILDSGEAARVKQVATQFIREFMGPADLMGIVHTDDRNREVAQGLTNDKQLLLASVDAYAGNPGQGSFSSFAVIKSVAVNLNSVSGRRKAIVFIGRGTNMLWAARSDSKVIELQQQLWREWNDAVKTLARNNVRVYPIDPQGFLSPNEGKDFASGASFGRGAENSTSLLRRPFVPSPEAQSELRLMAEDTGGIAIVNTNNFAGNMKLIVRDNSSYYVLGYYSPAERDGRFHPITVRLKNRPDLSIRGSRAGYTASPADVKGRSAGMPKGLSTAARDALRTAAPVGGLPVEIFTATFQADKFDGSILIGSHVPGAMLNLARNQQIEMSYVAVDRWNTVRASARRAFTINLSDDARARVAETGLRLFGRLQLPRGRYQIRVVAHQPGGATGSAVTDVEIPDFTDLPLTVSDLVVASSKGRTLLTLEEDRVLRRQLPSQPSANRRFSRSETLTVFGEIYDSHWILSQRVGVSVLITAEDGRVVAQKEDTLKSENLGRFYFNGTIPLARLADGAYTMTLEAHTSVGVPAAASQQLRFEVKGD